MRESATQHKCLEFLARHRIFAWRNNTGAFSVNNRWVRYGHPGSSDIIGVTAVVITPDMVGKTIGVFTGVECKSPAGKQTTDQALFERMVTSRGGIYILARSVEDLATGLDSYGVHLGPVQNGT